MYHMNNKAGYNSYTDFQRRLQNSQELVIGLEYYVYIRDNLQEPFVCLICTSPIKKTSKKGSTINMLNHAISIGHQLKYLEVDYPSVHSELKKFQNHKEASDEAFKSLLKLICNEIFNSTINSNQMIFMSQKTFPVSSSLILKKIFNQAPPRKDPKLLDKLHNHVTGYLNKAEERLLKYEQAIKEKLMNEPKNSPNKMSQLEEKYSKEYEEVKEHIQNMYKTYVKQPDQHPKFNDEWKYFFTQKLNAGKLEEANKFYFTQHLMDRYTKFEILETLALKLQIREKLGLEIEEQDTVQYVKLKNEETEKEKWLNEKKEVTVEEAEDIKKEIDEKVKVNQNHANIVESLSDKTQEKETEKEKWLNEKKEVTIEEAKDIKKQIDEKVKVNQNHTNIEESLSDKTQEKENPVMQSPPVELLKENDEPKNASALEQLRSYSSVESDDTIEENDDKIQFRKLDFYESPSRFNQPRYKSRPSMCPQEIIGFRKNFCPRLDQPMSGKSMCPEEIVGFRKNFCPRLDQPMSGKSMCPEEIIGFRKNFCPRLDQPLFEKRPSMCPQEVIGFRKNFCPEVKRKPIIDIDELYNDIKAKMSNQNATNGNNDNIKKEVIIPFKKPCKRKIEEPPGSINTIDLTFSDDDN